MIWILQNGRLVFEHSVNGYSVRAVETKVFRNQNILGEIKELFASNDLKRINVVHDGAIAKWQGSQCQCTLHSRYIIFSTGKSAFKTSDVFESKKL